MNSFLTLADTGDEMGYFRQVLETAQQKSEEESYAERRAQEMANGDMEDCSLEGKSCSGFEGCSWSYNVIKVVMESQGWVANDLVLLRGRGGDVGDGRNPGQGEGLQAAD